MHNIDQGYNIIRTKKCVLQIPQGGGGIVQSSLHSGQMNIPFSLQKQWKVEKPFFCIFLNAVSQTFIMYTETTDNLDVHKEQN